MRVILATFLPIKRYDTIPPLKVRILLMLDSGTALESLYAGVNLISLVIVEQVIYGEKEEGEENSFLKNMADLICQLG